MKLGFKTENRVWLWFIVDCGYADSLSDWVGSIKPDKIIILNEINVKYTYVFVRIP